jgi:hypothetical protein
MKTSADGLHLTAPGDRVAFFVALSKLSKNATAVQHRET